VMIRKSATIVIALFLLSSCASEQQIKTMNKAYTVGVNDCSGKTEVNHEVTVYDSEGKTSDAPKTTVNCNPQNNNPKSEYEKNMERELQKRHH